MNTLIDDLIDALNHINNILLEKPEYGYNYFDRQQILNLLDSTIGRLKNSQMYRDYPDIKFLESRIATLESQFYVQQEMKLSRKEKIDSFLLENGEERLSILEEKINLLLEKK